VYHPSQAQFLSIPQSPLCYWLRERFIELLQGTTLGHVSKIVQQVITADNNRFLRYVWEIPQRRDRWLNYLKAGGYARWDGLDNNLLDWQDNGEVLKSAILNKYQYLNGNWGWLVKEDTFFKAGWTYTLMAQGSIGARILEKEYICDSASPAVIPEEQRPGIGASLNCRLTSYMLRALSSGLKFRESYVLQAPVPIQRRDSFSLIEASCVALKRELLANDPTERRFAQVPMGTDGKLIARLSAGISRIEHTAALLHALEGISERLVFSSHGITGEDMEAVLNETGHPAGWHCLITGYDALPEIPRGVPPACKGLLEEHLSAIERTTPSSQTLARIKNYLRAQYLAGPEAKPEDILLRENPHFPLRDGEHTQSIGAYVAIPSDTFLEQLSRNLEIHPISIYWLLEEMRHDEGLFSPPELKRLTEDYFSVKLLRMLGHRWPMQDQYERNEGHGSTRMESSPSR